MDIDRSNSIFELFAAFNFANAILTEKGKIDNTSDSNFSDIIINTHLRIFHPFFDKGQIIIQDIKGQINTSEELLKSANIQRLTLQEKSTLKTIKSNLVHLLGLVTRWQDKVDQSKSQVKAKINGIFPFLSFLTAIFCVGVLGVSISQSPYRHTTLLALFCPTLVFYIYIFFQNGKNGYMRISNFYFGFVLILILLHMSLRYFGIKDGGGYRDWVLFFDTNGLAKHLLIFFCLSLPFAHFIIFLYWCNSSLKGIQSKKESEIESFVANLTELKDDLNKIANK